MGEGRSNGTEAGRGAARIRPIATAAGLAALLSLTQAAPGRAAGPPVTFPGAVTAGAPPAARLLAPDPTTVPGAEEAGAPTLVRLTNGVTQTTWAHPVRSLLIRRGPSFSSHVIRRLWRWTSDGFPEVYLVLAAERDGAGRWWAEIRLPMRPNGRKGWVRREALGALHVDDTLLVVNRHTLRATLFVGGRRRWRAPVGVGKPSTPTPRGHFWIREGFAVRGDPLYGPYAFGTSDYSVLTDWPGGGVVGVHGTDQPSLVPGRPSHGCIRMHNRDIRWLSRHMPIGTPVDVL